MGGKNGNTRGERSSWGSCPRGSPSQRPSTRGHPLAAPTAVPLLVPLSSTGGYKVVSGATLRSSPFLFLVEGFAREKSVVKVCWCNPVQQSGALPHHCGRVRVPLWGGGIPPTLIPLGRKKKHALSSFHYAQKFAAEAKHFEGAIASCQWLSCPRAAVSKLKTCSHLKYLA